MFDKKTRIHCYLFFFRTLKPRSPMTGMSVRRSMTLMTKNQKTGTSLSTSLTQMPRNPTTGMMRWTESGNHHRLTTQITRFVIIKPFTCSHLFLHSYAFKESHVCSYLILGNFVINRENGNQNRSITLTTKESGSTQKLITLNTHPIPTFTNMMILELLDLISGR